MHRVALLLLIGAVALTAAKAPIDHCCSAGDRTLVQKQWRNTFHNHDAKFRSGVARLILQKVLEVHLAAAALFKNVDVDNPNGGPFTAHCMRIFNAIDMVIDLLDQPEALEEALDHLAQQHHERAGVKKAYFTTFGQIMNRGLNKIIDRYDTISWKSCFRGILSKIASRLHE